MVVPVPTAFDPDLVFSALADATRRDIVLRAVSGHEGVAELAGHYPMSFAAVQKHVAILERAGLTVVHVDADVATARVIRAWTPAAEVVHATLGAAYAD